MPIDNLWLVTQSIRDMIKARTEPLMGTTVFTTVASPQSITSGTNLVSVYLFHLVEDSHYKNQPPRSGTSSVPISQVPLGLTLQYVVTTHSPSTTEAEQRGEQEQKLLGLTAKAIHDAPVLSVGTNERFQILVRPVSIEESVTFWSSDSSDTGNLTRPSLFVEARVLLLEPEPPELLSGTVLSVGSFVLVGSGPELQSSRSTLSFVPPGIALQQVRAEPARVALFQDGDTPFVGAPPLEVADRLNENNRLTLVGSQFGSGRRLLELERQGQRVRLDLTSPPPGTAIWVPSIDAGSISLRFWTTVFDELTGAPANLVPGIYGARLFVDQPPRPRSSNQTAFAVVPQVKSVVADGGDEYTLSVMGTYLQAPGLEVELAVGDAVLALVSTPTLNENEFRIATGSTIVFRRDPVSGEIIDAAHPLPVTLIINGAQSTPAWVTEAP